MSRIYYTTKKQNECTNILELAEKTGLSVLEIVRTCQEKNIKIWHFKKYGMHGILEKDLNNFYENS